MPNHQSTTVAVAAVYKAKKGDECGNKATAAGKSAIFVSVVIGKKYTTTIRPPQVEFVRRLIPATSKNVNKEHNYRIRVRRFRSPPHYVYGFSSVPPRVHGPKIQNFEVHPDEQPEKLVRTGKKYFWTGGLRTREITPLDRRISMNAEVKAGTAEDQAVEGRQATGVTHATVRKVLRAGN